MKKVIQNFVYVFGLVLLFASCSNFMKSQKVRDEILNAIDYNNALSYEIYVASDKNTGVIKNPAGGETQKKVTDVFNIEFDTAADYEFIKWKIIDSESKTEYQNGDYLLLESIDSEYTKCTFLKAPEDGIKLTLYAVVEKRPRVISYSPQWTAEGAYRDARIRVMFDQDMNSDSIYFNDAEIAELKAEYELTDSDFYKNGDQKVYYYVLDGLQYYKNISIVDYIKGTSILNKYGEPYFEDPRTLVIPANGDGPDAGTQILVSISNAISCIKQNKNVSLKDEIPWIYYVNINTDKLPPVLSDGSDINNSDNTHSVLASSTQSNPKRLHKGQLYLNLTVTDAGSGPTGFFTMNLENLDQTKTYSINIPYKNVTSNTANYQGVFSFPSYVSDGKYKIASITYKDKNDRPDTKEFNYYIIKDTTPPEITSIAYTPVDSSKLNFSFGVTDAVNEFQKVEIKMREKGSSEEWNTIPLTTTFTYGSSNRDINGIDFNKAYEFNALFYDEAYNTTEIITTNGYVNLKASASIQTELVGVSKAEDSVIHLNWDAPEGVLKYDLMVGEWSKDVYGNTCSFSVPTSSRREISKDNNSYNLTRKNVDGNSTADNVIKPAYAYLVRFKTYIEHPSIKQGYYSASKDIYVCTPTANTSIDINPSRIKVNWSIPQESPYRYPDTEMYLCYAESLDDLKSGSGTYKQLDLDISDTVAQSQAFDLKSTAFEGLYGKTCYFAIKSIVKLSVGDFVSSVEVTPEPSWSQVVCTQVPQPVQPPALKLKSNGTLHDKDISEVKVRLRFTPPAENWNRIDFYLGEEKKGSVSNTDPKMEYTFTGLNTDTQYTFSARTVYIDNGVTYESEPVSITAKTEHPLDSLGLRRGDWSTEFVWNDCSDVYIPSDYAGGVENQKVEKIQFRYILDDDSTDNSDWSYVGGKINYNGEGGYPATTTSLFPQLTQGKSYVIKLDTYCVIERLWSDDIPYKYTTNTLYVSY